MSVVVARAGGSQSAHHLMTASLVPTHDEDAVTPACQPACDGSPYPSGTAGDQ